MIFGRGLGTSVDGIRHWLWRAVDEDDFVQGILLQPHLDTGVAKTFLTKLLGEYDVPEVIHTDPLRNEEAAIRGLLSLGGIDHQVISTACCNKRVEQLHRPTRHQEPSQQRFKWKKRVQEGCVALTGSG